MFAEPRGVEDERLRVPGASLFSAYPLADADCTADRPSVVAWSSANMAYRASASGCVTAFDMASDSLNLMTIDREATRLPLVET